MIPYTYRPAVILDGCWLWALRIATMRAYVEQTWGKWDENEQRHFWARSCSFSHAWIVVVDRTRDAGLVDLERRGSEFFLNCIEIAPEFQGRGLGTAIMGDIMNEARGAGKPVRLQVLRVNPARKFYRRLGFVEIGETDYHVLLDWKP